MPGKGPQLGSRHIEGTVRVRKLRRRASIRMDALFWSEAADPTRTQKAPVCERTGASPALPHRK
jgi:hypothetical protein